MLAEFPPGVQFAPMIKRYGYVWPEDGRFRACFEVRHPGEIEDVELGDFETAREARRAVVAAFNTETEFVDWLWWNSLYR